MSTTPKPPRGGRFIAEGGKLVERAAPAEKPKEPEKKTTSRRKS